MCWFSSGIVATNTQGIDIDKVSDQNLAPLCQHWPISDISIIQFTCCSKSSFENLYVMIKKSFFILWQWNFRYLLSNNKSVMRYLVFGIYYIIRSTYKANNMIRTTISISDIYKKNILHNVKEMYSFGGHLANNICIVLVTMLTQYHLLFLKNLNLFLINSNVIWSRLMLSTSVWKILIN